jgi:hypothetical protein
MRIVDQMGAFVCALALAGCGDGGGAPSGATAGTGTGTTAAAGTGAPGSVGTGTGSPAASGAPAAGSGDGFSVVAEGGQIDVFAVGSAGMLKTDAFYALLGDGPIEQDPALMKTSFTTDSGGVIVTVAVTPDRFWGSWPKPVFATMSDKPGFFARVNETWTDVAPLRDGERILDVTAWGEGRAIAAIRMAEADIRFTLVGSTGGIPVPGPGKPTAEQEGCNARFDPDGALVLAGTASGHLFAAGLECKSQKPIAGFWKPKSTVEATAVSGLDKGARAVAIAAAAEDFAAAVFDTSGGTRLVDWDGKEWKASPSPGGKVTQMFAAGDGSLWMVSEKGLYWRKKGAEWSKMALPGEAKPTSAWARDASVVWVVVDGKRLLRKGPAAGAPLALPAASEVRPFLEREKRWPATRACKKVYVMLAAIGPKAEKPPATFPAVSDAVKGDAALTGPDVTYVVEEIAGNFWAGAKVPSFDVASMLKAAFKAKNPKAVSMIVCHEPLVKGPLRVE